MELSLLLGVRVLINNQIDFGRQRNLIIGSVILITGIGGLTINIGQITLSGMALSAIIGVILHLILPEKEASYGPRSQKTECELEIMDENISTSKEIMIKKQTTAS